MSRTLQQSATDAELAAQVADFYAHQMPLLEQRDLAAFAATFTDDCVFGYHGAWQLESRPALLGGLGANIPRYGASTIRHWFENRRVEVLDDGALRVTATCLVSITHPTGEVVFEPSCVVTDELVRVDGELLTRSRIIRHDLPDAGVYFARLAALHA
ncbi:actinorhodin biosynthesis protein ActVIA [Streptacidiphilus sp. MAP12-33]|uniref:nuclear transport factor 2 family protein n=1 Tax=Streptacidiphilus sp. MAP12-33 TaxID=3156266 RepID=UPI0035124464